MKNRSKTQRFLPHISFLLVGVIIGSIVSNTLHKTQEVSNNMETFETRTIVTDIYKVADDYVDDTAHLRYGFTNEDVYLLATLLCGSKDVNGDGEYDFDYGNDERYDQISLVLCVVMNRVRDCRFPNTVEEVVRANNGTTWQFHVMQKWTNKHCEVSDIALQRVREWCDAYDNYDNGVQSIPEDHVYFYGDGIENYSRI